MTPMQALAIKYSSLIFLTIQNSALTLTIRYSRTKPGPAYNTSTAVLLSEVLKCLTSLIIYLVLDMRKERILEQKKQQDDPGSLVTNNLSLSLIPISKQDLVEFLPLLPPAFLYTIQNNLQYVAISNLDAATFSVAYQGKVLTTAACAVVFLKKRLSGAQAGCILLLTIGVALASVPPKRQFSAIAIESPPCEQNHLRGIVAVGAACVISGFAGVYMEVVLKATQRPLTDHQYATMMFWHRNYQLAFISVLFAFPAIFVHDRKAIFDRGFLHGYSPLVWLIIFQQALGGITISLVITYADNILKNFATAVSIIISTMVSVVTWNTQPHGTFLVGMFAVLIATPMYGYADQRLPTITNNNNIPSLRKKKSH